LKISAGPRTLTINFSYLKDLMLSKDLLRLAELQKLGDGPCKFLDVTVDMKG
jgi:hypothetical protein